MQGLSPLAVALEDNGSADSVGYDDCGKFDVEAREASTETLPGPTGPCDRRIAESGTDNIASTVTQRLQISVTSRDCHRLQSRWKITVSQIRRVMTIAESLTPRRERHRQRRSKAQSAPATGGFRSPVLTTIPCQSPSAFESLPHAGTVPACGRFGR